MPKGSTDADKEAALRARLKDLVTTEVEEELVAVHRRCWEELKSVILVKVTDTLRNCVAECANVEKAHSAAQLPMKALDHVIAAAQSDAECCLLTVAARLAVLTNTTESAFSKHAISHLESATLERVNRDGLRQVVDRAIAASSLTRKWPPPEPS